MTIGIGAFGPNAGLAVYRALRAAEKVGTGAIGGFATFAAITEDGRVLYSVTQRGGASTAFTDGEITGVEPWPDFASARVAAVISSGPDRPGDLTRLIPTNPAVGLVTGHRIPLTKGTNGIQMNLDALTRMQAGSSAVTAAHSVTDESPGADCGLICVDVAGRIGVCNTERVKRRPDVATLLREDQVTGSAVGVLHNSINPFGAVAELAAAVAIETMAEVAASNGFVTIRAGTPIALGAEDAVFCDPNGNVLRVTTTDPAFVNQTKLAAPYLASSVWIGESRAGQTTAEPFTSAEHGFLNSFNGKGEFRIPYR
ncbi:DUF6963 family protein [Rhizobium miluonense]|uniref:Uncharacterized protein n=1 Tax=Rhizobium miluonense TaxID=411945 RepID=A0A1C3V6U3_9HYPH|nr:hypothetical protein [Rhizobium miluonense]SCB23482.1 hypothetical protein GA0061102_100978 [Rhizobium miluonense]